VYICVKVLGCLEFTARNTNDFKNELCLKTLFTSLVIHILMYCSIICSTSQIGIVKVIEQAQRRFLCFIVCKSKVYFNINPLELISLSSIKNSLNLDSLTNRRRYADIYFLSKLVNGFISGPELF
jgi:hypothetical protein